MIFLKRFRSYVSKTSKYVVINTFQFGKFYGKTFYHDNSDEYKFLVFSKRLFKIIVNPTTKELKLCKINKYLWRGSAYIVNLCYQSKKSIFLPHVVYITMHKKIMETLPDSQFTILTHTKRMTINYKIKMEPNWVILNNRKN